MGLGTKESKIKCALVNCQSVVNKTADFWCDLIENDFTLCVLTETWIRQEEDVNFVHQGSNQYQYLGKTGPVEVLQWSIRTYSLLDLGQHITTLQWNVAVFL